MFRTIRLKSVLVAVAIPLGAGLLGMLAAGGMRQIREVYGQIVLPAFAPPAWVFGPVWTILYICMGLASLIVWEAGVPPTERTRALTLYGVQLALNVLWMPLFFGTARFWGAFIELCVLLVVAIMATAAFALCNKKTLWLMMPYLFWLTYAAVLNRAIVALN